MKFLCSNCKAKYHIADEKIAGRTLRMSCRKCEHEIVIRADGMTGAEASGSTVGPMPQKPASRPPSIAPPRVPGASRGGSQVGPAPARLGKSSSTQNTPMPRSTGTGAKPAPSALGADFRKQVASTSQPPEPPPTKTNVLDQWHVSIHDVPVGPMKRDEVARKIQAGAVTGDSLVWREGFDDWRPLRDVVELSPLLRRGSVPPPAALKGPGVGRPGAARPIPRPTPSATQRPPAGRAATTSTGRTPSPDAARPAARSNVVPIGGRFGAAAAPTIDENLEEHELEQSAEEPTRLSAPPVADSAPAERRDPSVGVVIPPSAAVPAAAPAAVASAPPKRPLGPGVWMGIAGAAAFGGVAAIVIVMKVLFPTQPPVVNNVVQPAPVTPVAVAPQPVQSVAAATSTDNTPQQPQPQASQGTQVITRVITRTASPRPSPSASVAAAAATKGRPMSDAERELLARMGGGGSEAATPRINANIDPGEQGGAVRSELSDDQIRTIVLRNRPQLERCLQLGARRAGASDTFRIDVNLQIGASGTVTSVTAAGGPREAGTCIEGSVRRWRFPASAHGSPASFPLIFQPG